jgi:hypothetical protein
LTLLGDLPTGRKKHKEEVDNVSYITVLILHALSVSSVPGLGFLNAHLQLGQLNQLISTPSSLLSFSDKACSSSDNDRSSHEVRAIPRKRGHRLIIIIKDTITAAVESATSDVTESTVSAMTEATITAMLLNVSAKTCFESKKNG